MKNKTKKPIFAMVILCMVLTLLSPFQAQAKSKGEGSKENPYSAYNYCKTDVYGASYAGEFKIKLLDYEGGKDALKILKENGFKKNPGKSKEYVYLKFKIKCISADEDVPADLILNDYWSFFDTKCKKQLNVKRNSVKDGNKKLSSDTLISKGEMVVCSLAFSVKYGSAPVTYRISAGYDKDYNEIEKWFTTKK